jgi:hypothetical protein
MNRKGSKYCSKCGKRLDTLSEVCPTCNKANPTGSAFCGFCGASLPLPDGQTAASAPGNRPTQESIEEELPPWLYGAPEEPRPMREQTAAASIAATAAEGGKYLREIENVLPDTEAWLSSSQSQALAQPAPAKKETAGTPDTRSGARKGCLPLMLAIVLGLFVLAWVV